MKEVIVKLLNFLLKHNADANIQNKEGQTATTTNTIEPIFTNTLPLNATGGHDRTFSVTDTTYELFGDYSSVSVKDRLLKCVKNPFSSFDVSKKNVNPSDNADEQQTQQTIYQVIFHKRHLVKRLFKRYHVTKNK